MEILYNLVFLIPLVLVCLIIGLRIRSRTWSAKPSIGFTILCLDIGDEKEIWIKSVQAIPRVGDIIQLKSKENGIIRYRVLEVVHEIDDLSNINVYVSKNPEVGPDPASGD